MANGYGINLGGMQDPERWQQLLRDLQQGGIAIDPGQTFGQANRNIAGTDTPSLHSYGRALDVNASSNPEGFRYNLQPDRRPFDPMNITPDAEGDRPGQTAIPTELAQAIAAKNQMKWGGDFRGRSPDPMHFELNRNVPQAPQSGPQVANLSRAPAGFFNQPQPPASDTGRAPPLPQAYGPSGAPPGVERRPDMGRNYRDNPAFQAGMSPTGGGGLFELMGGDPNSTAGRTLAALNAGIGSRGVAMALPLAFGNAGAQSAAAGQGASLDAIRQAAAQREHLDYGEKLDRRQTQRKLWGEAFPNGQANPTHPLLAGIPPALAQTIHGLGPEEGLVTLGKIQMDELQKRRALELQREQGRAMAEAVLGPGTFQQAPGGAGGQVPQGLGSVPQTAVSPSVAPSGVPGTAVQGQGPGFQVPVPSFGTPPQMPPVPSNLQPSGGTPYSFQGGQRSAASGEAVLQDPQLRRIMMGHIMAGKPDAAMTAYEKALERAQGPRLAGEKKYAEEAAETQATTQRSAESMREAWGLLDDLERNAKALGNARLNAAASPTLDTWTGQNVQRHITREAYADRQQLLPYLEQLTVLARAQLKGQGSLTDQENEMLQKTLTSARNATSAETFFQNINVARSILSRKIPEMKGYTPPHVLRQEREQAEFAERTAAPPAGAPAETGKPLTPPKNATRTDTLEGMEGAQVYDHKTGNWGTVVNGEFVPRKKRRGTTSDAIRQMYAQ